MLASEDTSASSNQVLDVGNTLQSNTATAFRSQIHSLFWQEYAPQIPGRTGASLISTVHTVPSLQWLYFAFQNAHIDETLNAALSALSTARVGRLHNDQSMIYQAVGLHNKAIVGVRNAIAQRGDAMYHDTLLATILTLGLFEASSNPFSQPEHFC